MIKHSQNFNDTSVVMITKNEEKAVSKVIRDIKKAAPGAEIIIIDSSADKTPEIAKKNGAKVVRQFPPKGYGKAMVRALETPKRPIVVTLDCDDTYPAEIIPSLVKDIRDGYDLVNTTRTYKKPENMPWPNYFANRVFAFSTWLIHGLATTDVHSGMRSYRKSMLETLILNPARGALPVELYILPFRLGYKCKEVPIEYRPRLGETTLEKWEGVKWTYKRIWYLRQPKKYHKAHAN